MLRSGIHFLVDGPILARSRQSYELVPRLFFLSAILFVADPFHPIGRFAIHLFLNSNMCQSRGRGGAMPMLLTRLNPNYVTWPNLLDGATPALYQTGTGYHDQSLAQRMSVPRGTRAGLERHTGTYCTGRSVPLKQGINAYITSEILDRPFGGGLRPASSDLQVLLAFQARCVDHKAITHVPSLHSLVSLIDLFRSDNFDIRDNSLLAAVVKHLLRFLNPADVEAREAFVPKDERARVNGSRTSRGRGQTKQYHCAIATQESHQLVEIVRCADGVDDEIEPALKRVQGSRLLRGDEVLRT